MTAYCAYNSPQLTTNGMVYSGDVTLPPNAVPITASGCLQITTSTNGDTLAFQSNALQTTVVSGPNATLSVNCQYIIDNAPFAGCDLFMPATGLAAIGDMIHIVVYSAGDSNEQWTLHLSPAQNIAVGNSVSNSGTIAGPADQKNVITIMCVNQSPEFWVSFNVMGNLIIT